MKDIKKIYYNLLSYKQNSCTNYSNKICNKEICECKIYSEIWAYIAVTIPESYHNSTLQDFTGMYDGNSVLSKNVVKKAREKIIKYCWKDIKVGEDYEHQQWFDRSIIDNRFKTGTSLVIYGDSWTNNLSIVSQKFTKKRVGKTLIASIVMKEAIMQRIKPSRSADSYAWCDYSLFINRLMSNANDNKFEDEIYNYLEAEWLVIDNIENVKNGENAKQFRNSVLDQFFYERLEKNLPTIFVFQENISNIINLKEEYGRAIYDIINNHKTHHIDLIEK